ncbi:MAG: serine hydrolase, partial [Clostridia bacterium]|nr:serine hydrolase [Clostridia bacterium]
MKNILKLSFVLLLIACVMMGTVSARPLQVVASKEVDISSKGAFLMEYDSGEVLFSKEETKHLPVASMVKMMTILIALEELDAGNVALDTKITTTENASS